jgi:hypothetical protein
MGKSKSAKMDVTNYHMSLHFGLACGADKLKTLWVNEKTLWQGSLDTEGAISVNQPDLFGGQKKEGGAVGTVHFLPGRSTQVMPEELAAKMGRTSATCPAYRGIASIFFHGAAAANNPFQPGSGYSAGGFLWSSNNPIIAQSVWAEIERAPKGLDPERAMIGPDANPAHMIFECLVNTDWGLGLSSTLVDGQSFSQAAEILDVEAFGLSMIWTKQAKIEDFISEILDHIQATFFIHPRTGLYTLKLLRDDYDVGTLRVMYPDNATVTSFQRKMWGETINEIAVTWTNPVNEQEETVTVQNLAAVAAQGAPIADSRNYYGVRNRDLAMRLASRDLRVASAPLATIEVELDRSSWDLVPGEVVIVDWPEYDLDGLIMRVGSVDFGKVGDPVIRATLLEDVFSLERAGDSDSADTGWTRPGELPAPMAHTQVLTLPAFFGNSTDLQAGVLDLSYPDEVVAMVLAHQTGFDTPAFELLSEQTLSNGATDYAAAGTKATLDRITLSGAMPAATTSVLLATDIGSVRTGPQVGGFVFIGAGGDASVEIALVDSYDGFDWMLARGVLDTVPRDWPAGTPVWFVNTGVRIVDDQTVRAPGETPDYKLLSRTSLGILPEADAPIISGTMTARPHLPLRPANVKVNGLGFGTLAIGAAPNITITWSTRNRTLEDGQVVRWNAAQVVPEYAQETVVTVFDPDGVQVYQQGSLWTETTLVLPASNFARYPAVTIQVKSRRDGLWSLQSHSIGVSGLANNPAAALPPAPPPPTLPPAPTAAPGVGVFSVTGTAISNPGGASTPTILVVGTPDNADATGLVIRYHKTGSTDYTYWPTVVLRPGALSRTALAPLAALTDYVVEVAYEVGNNPLGAFRILLPNPVTTGAFVADDVVSIAGRNALLLVEQIDTALTYGDDIAEALLNSEDAVTRVDGIESNLGPNGATAATKLAALADADTAQALRITGVEASVGGSPNLLVDPTFANSELTPFSLGPLPSTWRNTFGAVGFGAVLNGDGYWAYTYGGSTQVAASVNYVDVTAGEKYSFQAEFYHNGGPLNGRVFADILFTDARGLDDATGSPGLIGAAGTNDVTITATTGAVWTRKTTVPGVGVTAPPGAKRAYIRLWSEDATDPGGTRLKGIRKLQLERGVNPSAWTDPTAGTGLAARVAQTQLATADLLGKTYARYVVEADAQGVMTGIYLLSERGAAGQRLSAIKLRTDLFAIVSSDGANTKYPFLYDATLGKLVLNEVVAQSANIGALAVKTLNLDGFAVTTDKLRANAVTNSVNVSSTATSGDINVSSEVTLMSLNINVTESTSRVEILSDMVISANGSAVFEYRIYRNGALLLSTFYTSFMLNYCIPYSDFPGIGNHNYEVRTFRTNNVSSGAITARYRYLTCTEVKR